MATFTTWLAAGSAAADKYSLTLQVDTTHVASSNKDTVRVRGTIKSHHSSYTSYRSSSSNTVKVTDEDGTTHLSKNPTTAYDCRNQGSTQIFDYTFDVPHGSDGKRTLYFSWTFDGLQSSWNPAGTVTGTLELTRTSYTVSFNSNGGSGAPGNQTKYYGTALVLSSTKPTREGYTFLGWGTSASDTTVDYGPGASYSSNASITLYAIWTLNTYVVSYNENGGSGAPGAQTKYYGSALELSSTKPTRTGYTFVNWNTKSDGSGTSYAPGATYTGNEALMLYAIWSIITYTVSYNANGGSGAPESQTKKYGVNLILSKTIPVRQGYKFIAWGTSPTDTTADYTPGGVYSNNASIALYAIWKEEGLMHLTQKGETKKGKAWINDNGVWKTGIPWIKINGVWRKGGS